MNTTTRTWLILAILAAAPLALLAGDAEPDGGRRLPRRRPGLIGGRHRPGSRPARPLEDRHRPRTRPARALLQEHEAAILEFVRKHRPERHQQLLDLRDTDPRRYRALLWRLHGMVRRLRHLPEPLQEMALKAHDARAAIPKLVAKYRHADDEATRRALLETIHEHAAAYFDAEQKLGRYQIHKLEQRLKEAKAKLAERAEHRQEHIKKIVKRVVSKSSPRGHRGMHGGPRTRPAKRPRATDE